jgi:hypothetical protein
MVQHKLFQLNQLIVNHTIAKLNLVREPYHREAEPRLVYQWSMNKWYKRTMVHEQRV